MKKALPILTLLVAVSTVALFAQPFLGLGITNKGANFQAGALVKGFELTGAYRLPLTSNETAKIASLSIGKQILLSHNEQDNYSITPSLGYANCRYQDFEAYNADPTGRTGITQVNEFKPIYGIEIGKDSHLGRVYLSANYCGAAYFGAGIKMFLYRN